MKKIVITAITSSMFCMLTLLMAEEITKKGDGFFKINDNIQNEELRAELENLKNEFNIKRKKIHEQYQEQIEILKDSRKKEIHL